MISFAIDRTSLALTPLVLSDDTAGSYVILDEGWSRPSFEWRRTYAPDSRNFRRQILAAVRDAVDVPFVVNVHGTTPADLEAKVNAIEAALGQFVYDATLTIDGQARTYECEVCGPAWEQDGGMVRAHMAKATFTVPINPGA